MGNLIKLLGLLFVILFFAGVGWLAYGSYEYMKNKSSEASAETTEANLSGSTDLALAGESSDMDEDEDEFFEEDEDLLEDDEIDELLEIDGVLDEIESSVMEAEEAAGETVSNTKDKLSAGANSLANAGAATLDKAKTGISEVAGKAKAGISDGVDKAKAGVSEFTEKAAKASSESERSDIPADYEKTVNLSPKDLYFVITGSFTIAENAEKEVKAMRKKGYSKAETVQFASTKYLSVCVGRFNNMAEARKMVAKIKNESKLDAYVHKRRLK